MKTKFLALVEEVKKIGIVESLSETSNADVFNEVWDDFEDEQKELFVKIKNWATEFNESGSDFIFAKGEKFDNPLEIVAVIAIIDDEDVSECEIFEDWEDLIGAVMDANGKFGEVVAKYLICEITAENIFSDEEDEEDEED